VPVLFCQKNADPRAGLAQPAPYCAGVSRTPGPRDGREKFHHGKNAGVKEDKILSYSLLPPQMENHIAANRPSFRGGNRRGRLLNRRRVERPRQENRKKNQYRQKLFHSKPPLSLFSIISNQCRSYPDRPYRRKALFLPAPSQGREKLYISSISHKSHPFTTEIFVTFMEGSPNLSWRELYCIQKTRQCFFTLTQHNRDLMILRQEKSFANFGMNSIFAVLTPYGTI